MNDANTQRIYTVHTATATARQQLEEEAAQRRYQVARAALLRHHNYKEDWRHERAHQIRKLYEARKARRIQAMISGLIVAGLLAAAVSLAFLFVWQGFDPGLVSSWSNQ